MSFLVNAEHFLNLRLRLQGEVLGAAATHDGKAALAAAALGVQHDARRLVDVGVGVNHARVPLELQRRDVHADRTVAGARCVHRHPAAIGGT